MTDFGPFKVSLSPDFISINGFSFSPAEGEKMKSAVSFARGMRDFEALPPSINFELFTVSFFEDGRLELTRQGSPSRIEFSFDLSDTLVDAVSNAVAMYVDNQKLSPGRPKRQGFAPTMQTGDVIEGR